jgi:hypothetical protein
VLGQAGRNVERRVAVEEPGWLEHESIPIGRNDTPVFRPGVKGIERMRDLICVTKVIDTQAAAFSPVASWRATTGVPSAGQRHRIGGSIQFCHGALRRQPHNAITPCHGVSGALCAGFGHRHASGTTDKA